MLGNFAYDLMGGSNTAAGIVEAAQGAANLVVALPIGVIADRHSKARVIALGGWLIPIAVGATSFAVIYGAAHADEPNARTLCFGIFIGAMCLWGAVSAISGGPAQALYADSIATGTRRSPSLFGAHARAPAPLTRRPIAVAQASARATTACSSSCI